MENASFDSVLTYLLWVIQSLDLHISRFPSKEYAKNEK